MSSEWKKLMKIFDNDILFLPIEQQVMLERKLELYDFENLTARAESEMKKEVTLKASYILKKRIKKQLEAVEP